MWTWSRKPFSDRFLTERVVSSSTTALHLHSQVESLISRLTSENVIAWFIFSILQESKANTNLLQRNLLERLETALTRKKKMAVFVLCSIAYNNLCLWFREDLATGIMTLVCLKHGRRYRDILTAPQNLLGRRSGWMNGSTKVWLCRWRPLFPSGLLLTVNIGCFKAWPQSFLNHYKKLFLYLNLTKP